MPLSLGRSGRILRWSRFGLAGRSRSLLTDGGAGLHLASSRGDCCDLDCAVRSGDCGARRRGD